jgi:hypothetical protein
MTAPKTTHPDSIGSPAHDDAAETDAEPNEGPGKRRGRAGAVEVAGDGLQGNHCNPGGTERARHGE